MFEPDDLPGLWKGLDVEHVDPAHGRPIAVTTPQDPNPHQGLLPRRR